MGLAGRDLGATEGREEQGGHALTSAGRGDRDINFLIARLVDGPH